MKYRTMKKLLSAVLTAAVLTTVLPANLTFAQAADTFDASSTLEDLGIIDAPGEEDTTGDLPDKNKDKKDREKKIQERKKLIAKKF